MQASKIKIGDTYAIKSDNRLVRFRVEAVITKRKSNHNNPHDFKSWVEGTIYVEDREEGSNWDGHITDMDPDRILGPYEEHLELVKRQNAERDAAAAKENAEQAAVDEVRRLLYALIGQEVPPLDERGRSSHNDAIRIDYGGAIKIDIDGVEALLPVLRKLTAAS